jgi:hypothetical protein
MAANGDFSMWNLIRPGLGCLLSCAVAGAIAQSQDAQPQYGIREEAPKTGSMIRQYSVPPIDIPINLPWDRLAAADRAKFDANYERIEPGDEPPFPVDGLRTLVEPLLKAQQKLLVEGPLVLVATIDAQGQVDQVKIIGAPSAEMAQFAGKVMLLTKFKPAVCGGHACRMQFPLRLDFAIR